MCCVTGNLVTKLGIVFERLSLSLIQYYRSDCKTLNEDSFWGDLRCKLVFSRSQKPVLILEREDQFFSQFPYHAYCLDS